LCPTRREEAEVIGESLLACGDDAALVGWSTMMPSGPPLPQRKAKITQEAAVKQAEHA
jgi:hypothetical protein